MNTGQRATRLGVIVGGVFGLLLFAVFQVACAEPQEPLELVAIADNGHGVLCRTQGKRVLIVQGSPAEMGTAHGELLAQQVHHVVNKLLYVVGAAETVRTGRWFFDTMDEIQRRCGKFVPERYWHEIDALAKAAGVSYRDARFANLFPERFHCSGVAVRGKATKGGRVLHARVLDYMRDIGLQEAAVLIVFIPNEGNTWLSVGYAGFIGTVTAMNEKGLAIGEMGGGGVGQWDGMPMAFLLRKVMEETNSVPEALRVLQTAPRTCEYYYVLSDKKGNLAAVRATPDEFLVLKPGQQHPLLPPVPEDTVFVSGGDRAVHLSNRLHAYYGRIDVPALIEIIKRPVAMESNLHNAIFAPQSLDVWFSDAGRNTPACDEPYAHCNLKVLVDFFNKTVASGSKPHPN